MKVIIKIFVLEGKVKHKPVTDKPTDEESLEYTIPNQEIEGTICDMLIVGLCG